MCISESPRNIKKSSFQGLLELLVVYLSSVNPSTTWGHLETWRTLADHCFWGSRCWGMFSAPRHWCPAASTSLPESPPCFRNFSRLQHEEVKLNRLPFRSDMLPGCPCKSFWVCLGGRPTAPEAMDLSYSVFAKPFRWFKRGQVLYGWKWFAWSVVSFGTEMTRHLCFQYWYPVCAPNTKLASSNIIKLLVACAVDSSY